MSRRLSLFAWCLLPALLAAAGDSPPGQGPPARPLEEAFLPTVELRVNEFRSTRPDADGRGVIVAILDTGVDPGHPRLSTTTTGERKIIDLLDATDDGVVALDTPIERIGDRAVGKSGRLLDLGTHVRPGKKAALGLIDAHSVLPSDLVDRLRTKRRERLDLAVRRAKEAGGFPFAPRDKEAPDAAQARREAELDARAALPDETPVFDVLGIETAEGPRIVIDVDADGDLAEEMELAEYALRGDWVTLKDDAELNVAVRPEADLTRVRILFDGAGHGTHVAGIVAGHDPAGGSLEGVAPGARILSIKIGNSRFGSATTNLAIVRALEWAGRRGASIVNLSFGGPSFVGDASSADARAADEAIERYGLLCCFSAGNEGPLLSTVGSPGTARRVLSVGAYVSPATMCCAYGRLDREAGERLFVFSSRGPLPGGDLGISVLAPGSAWSTVPPWQLIRGDNWHGTSMAAPEVSGAAALLVCAASAEKIKTTPLRLVRALRASARRIPGLMSCEQGAGLVQVDRAYDALVAMRALAEDRRLEARTENETGSGGGIYLRGLDGIEPVDRRIQVGVDWPRDVTNEERTAYERRLVLSCDAPWVEIPPRCGVNASGGGFPVRIHPKTLGAGVHEALIRAIDPDRPEEGPVLEVPVTAIRPAPLDADARFRDVVTIQPGERVARFFRVPSGASSLRVRLKSGFAGRQTFTLAAGSLDVWRRPPDRVAERRIDLDPGAETQVSASVAPDAVAEVVVFSHWNGNGVGELTLEVSFAGPVSPESEVRVGPGVDVALVRLSSPLAPLRADVSAVLDQLVERPVVTKDVGPDANSDPVLGGDRLFVSTQRFSVEVRDGETATVVPLGDAALDELREDARWRVVDAAGRVVKKAVVDGAFELGGMSAGRYTIEYETPTWRRAAADAGLTGFEVRRRIGGAWASVHPLAEAAAERRDASSSIDWPQGAVRSVALRLPDLEAGRSYRGRVEVRVDGEVRLSLPLTVDRRTSDAPDPTAAEAALVASLSQSARSILDDPDASLVAKREALARADRALALRAGDVGLEELALRAALALAGDTTARPDAVRRAEALWKKLDRARADHRAALGRVLLVRAVTDRLDGKPSDADYAEARFLLSDDDSDVLYERVRRGRAPKGDARDALAAAKARRDRRPTSFLAEVDVIEAELALGWGVAAAREWRSLADRFPLRRTEARAFLPRIRAAGGDPAPRTLDALAAGAP